MAGLIGKKIEMTRIIKENKFIPVTLVEIRSNTVHQIKTNEKDGYEALVLHAPVQSKAGKLREVSCKGCETVKNGDVIGLEKLEEVETVKITSISKGKWFAGAMKRHNFHGGQKTHGSKFHRALGSIGNRKPRRTKPGKKMHGHMGNKQVTIQRVPVEHIDKENCIVALRGWVPGARNSLIMLCF